MKPLLNRKKAAALLGKPESWISYAVQRGLLDYVRVGQQLRFRQETLERWVETNTIRARAARTRTGRR